MDFFGIGAAFMGMASAYQDASRGTGRTTSLLESVKDGDRVVFVDRGQAEPFERSARERGVKIECIVVDPQFPSLILDLGPSQGRTVFDHVFVERFHAARIGQAIADLDYCERRASGPQRRRQFTRGFYQGARMGGRTDHRKPIPEI